MMGNKKRCLTFSKLRSSSQSHCDGRIDADFFTLMLLYSWEKVLKKKLTCFIVNGKSAEAQTLDIYLGVSELVCELGQFTHLLSKQLLGKRR